MPKFSDVINLSAAMKAAACATCGGVAVVGAQRYMGSSESSKAPQKEEVRGEQKKMGFEIQQLSAALEKEKREVEMSREDLAKGWANLREAKAAFQQQQAATTAVVVAEPAKAVAVTTVEPEEAPTPPEAKKEMPAAPIPMNNTPKRPAVFDGGNKEPAPTAKDEKEPSVTFGSSGDVVTIEKGGAVPNAETEHLRIEVENLRRRLAEKDDASREREERLREQERALWEKLWKRNVESKATQTDDHLSEAATGDDDPSNKPDADGIQNKITDNAAHTISSSGSNVSPERKIDPVSAREEKNNVSTMNKNSVLPVVTQAPVVTPASVVNSVPVVVKAEGTGSGIPTPPTIPPPPLMPGTIPQPPVIVTGGGAGGPPPPGAFIPVPVSVPTARRTPRPASVKAFVQELEKEFIPALEEVKKELKEKAEEKRKIAKEAELLSSLKAWHPIAMARRCIKDLDDDDKVIEENKRRKAEGKQEVTPLNRDTFAQNTCIALDKCARDLAKKPPFVGFGFNDCMMRLLLMFINASNTANEKTVLEIFQEKLWPYWLDAFTYFVTTPKSELVRAYKAYKQEMVDRIKPAGDGRYCCYGFPKGEVKYYSTYEECCKDCVDFVVFDKEKNDTFVYAELLYRYVSQCETVARCKKTNLETLRDNYIMRLAKLLLRNKLASSNPIDPAHRNKLLKSVIEEVTKEVTSNCTEKKLTEPEKKHKGEEIRILIRMNQDSLFDEKPETKELGTKNGNVRFIKIVEMALSKMTKKVSKTEGDNWLLHLDAALFSFFGINISSTPKIPNNKKWFSDIDISNALKELKQKIDSKKDANLEELKGMVKLCFLKKMQSMVDYMRDDTTSKKFRASLNSALRGSSSIADRMKTKKVLQNIKEADLKGVLSGLLGYWNTLVEGFEQYASFLGMKTTKMEKGNAVEAVVPMTPERFKEVMSNEANGLLKAETYTNLAEKERKAYLQAKLFPIASKLRQIVIDSRENKSDTLTVGFTEDEYRRMHEASAKCKGLLKLVLSYAKAKKLVLEGPWIYEFLASCPKDNVKSLTLKNGSFGIDCLGKISTSIDEVTFEEMELDTLDALWQFIYMETGNSLTLKNVDCAEDYYEGETGAIQEIRNNGATVKTEGCLWYKNGTRPTVPPGAAGAPMVTPGGAPITTTSPVPSSLTNTTTRSFGSTFNTKTKFSKHTPKPGTTPARSNFTFPQLKTKQQTTNTVPGSSAKNPFGSRNKFTHSGYGNPGMNSSGSNFTFPNLKKAPSNATPGAGSGSSATGSLNLAAMRGNLKAKQTTNANQNSSQNADPFGIFDAKKKLKPVMHKGMLNKNDKEDLRKEFDGSGVKNGTDIEKLLLERLREEWDKVPEGEPIPVDVPFCKVHLKEVIKAADDFAKTRNTDPGILLSGDFDEDNDTAALENLAMVEVVEALKDVKKIKTDMKSENGANIAFQGQLFETMSRLKRNGTGVKTEEIEISGWKRDSGDSGKVLEAVGKLGLKKFEVSNMHEDMLRNSNFSTSNRKSWEKLLNNTKNVSFKNQKMDSTALDGLFWAVKNVKKNGGQMPHIELPTPPTGKPGATRKTCEEIVTEKIINEITTTP